MTHDIAVKPRDIADTWCLFMFQGDNLNLVLTDSELKVRVGSRSCNVTSLSLTQLNCEVPKFDSADNTDSSDVDVTVSQ